MARQFKKQFLLSWTPLHFWKGNTCTQGMKWARLPWRQVIRLCVRVYVCVCLGVRTQHERSYQLGLMISDWICFSCLCLSEESGGKKNKNSIYLLKLPHHLVHYASCWCAVMGWFIRAPTLEMCYLTANFSVSRRTDWKIHFALALRFTAVSLCSVLRLQQLTKLS